MGEGLCRNGRGYSKLEGMGKGKVGRNGRAQPREGQVGKGQWEGITRVIATARNS